MVKDDMIQVVPLRHEPRAYKGWLQNYSCSSLLGVHVGEPQPLIMCFRKCCKGLHGVVCLTFG